jgi:site-specific DNA recombinase
MDKRVFRKSVGIWIRVSTEMQAQGESPENHERRARDYASAKDWDVVEVYRLDGVSGAVSLEHSEAKRMLRDVEGGRIKALIASKFARIVRDGVQFRLLHRRFKQANADLISLDENIDTSTPAGELVLGIIADLAEWERKEIASRVRASVKPRAQAGKPLGGDAPFGYQWKERKLVPHPDEAPVRRMIHELYVEHRRKRVVARILNEKGYRTRKGRLWSAETIDWLLCDPSAKGLHRRNYIRNNGPTTRWSFKPESDIIHVPVEPVVAAKVWDDAHSILTATKNANRRLGKPSEYLFTGIVSCSCGLKLYGRPDSPNYLCNAGGNGCGRRVRRSFVETAFESVLCTRLTAREWACGYAAAARHALTESEKRVSLLEAEREEAKRTIQMAFGMVSRGQMPESRYHIVCEPHEARLRQIEEELPEVQSVVRLLRLVAITPESVLKDTNRLAERWQNSSFGERRAFLESWQVSVNLDEAERLRIELQHFPFTEDTVNEQRTLSRPASPFEAGRGFGRASCAPPFLSAAVAQF